MQTKFLENKRILREGELIKFAVAQNALQENHVSRTIKFDGNAVSVTISNNYLVLYREKIEIFKY